MSDDRQDRSAEVPEEEWEAPPVPFSFKLTLILVVVYLGYRLVQLVMCVPSFFRGDQCPFW